MLKMKPNIVLHKSFCQLPFNKIILNGYGDLSMCCYQNRQLGNILGDKSILEIWNSDIAKEIRKETEQNKLHSHCTAWNTCPFLVKPKTETEYYVHEGFKLPAYMEICLPNTHCNIGGEDPSDDNPACIMCCRNYEYQKQPPITHILVEKAKPLMPYLYGLCILGIAEPFWKDAVFNMFEQLEFHKHADRITFSTNTNVTCLTDRVIERFFKEVKKSNISFSLDAATPETYQKIRRIDGYDVVVRNVKNYMAARKKSGGQHEIYVYNNINVINVHEMVMMVEFAAENGIMDMIMLPTHDQCGRVHMDELLLNSKNVKVFKKYSEAALKRAKELGVNLFYSKPFDIVPPSVQELVQIQLSS